MTVRVRFRARVLFHGMVVLLVMAVLITLGDRLVINPRMQAVMRDHDAWVAERALSPPYDDRQAIARQIEEARRAAQLELSVYGADGALVATNIEPPLAAPPRAAWARLAARHPEETDAVLASGLFDGERMVGVVVTRRQIGGPPLALVTLVLAAFVLATLFVAVPLSRSFVEPLEALVGVVRRFGGGDLSARAKMPRGDEIGDLAAAFDQMAARIESHVRAEKELLANVSHELRTPLARIRVVVELASDGDASRVKSYLAEIASDLTELERLLQDVITTARLDLGAGGEDARVPLRWETIDPMRLVETSRARFESLHPGHPLALRLGEMPAALRCDPVLLRRAVDNLLDNAVKYAPDSRVELLVGAQGESFCFEVMDLGPGMTADAAARAFDPFFRADASRASTPGTGLGLAIVKRVVDAHGGTLDLETAPGRGTSITARVPLGSRSVTSHARP